MAIRKKEIGNLPGIVDIHCHILPGLDDGAADMAETLDMLQIAADEGVSDIIVTPHFHSGRRSATPDTILRVLWEVQNRAEKERIPIRLYPGNEIYYFHELPQALADGRVCTLNGSRYVLVEFSPSVMFRSLQNALDDLLNAGYFPILAHAERYECLTENREDVAFLHNAGVQIQVNASSVTGKSGMTAKRFTGWLLNEGIVDYVGTDAHGIAHRPPAIAKCRELLAKKYGWEYSSLLLNENAREILGEL